MRRKISRCRAIGWSIRAAAVFAGSRRPPTFVGEAPGCLARATSAARASPPRRAGSLRALAAQSGRRQRIRRACEELALRSDDQASSVISVAVNSFAAAVSSRRRNNPLTESASEGAAHHGGFVEADRGLLTGRFPDRPYRGT
jgi:hypothetical protein